jgi:hypothetical protein
MLLEEAIKQHKKVSELLNDMSVTLLGKKMEDDYMVRPYLVRAHWRRRPRKRLVLVKSVKGVR